MPEYRHVVLSSHGTRGAQAAERAALNLCASGATLSQLVVVPELWKGMMGDDWLNNASTRDAYGKHVERQLESEIAAHVQRVRVHAEELGLRYASRTVVGLPAPCLVAYCRELAPDLVVIGAPRPKGETGLRSRMEVEGLVRGLAAPLLVVPFPA